MAKILHVDDSVSVRNTVKAQLGAGHEIHSVGSIPEALDLLDRETFDLEIWDGGIMPGEFDDGARLAVTRKAQGHKVLILSAGSAAQDLAEEHRAAFLSKSDLVRLKAFVAYLITGSIPETPE